MSLFSRPYERLMAPSALLVVAMSAMVAMMIAFCPTPALAAEDTTSDTQETSNEKTYTAYTVVNENNRRIIYLKEDGVEDAEPIPAYL